MSTARSLAGRRVAVTGATGFIGQALCARLDAEGASVVALARREQAGVWQQFHALDLACDAVDPHWLAGVDTLFHLAAYTHAITPDGADAQAYWRTNVDGTRVLLEAARASGVRHIVFFSSVKAMGEGGEEVIDETWPEQPASDYGRSKLAAERLLLDAAAQGAIEVTVLRVPLVYGPGVKGNVRALLRAVVRGRFPPLSGLDNRRSMIHIDDLVQASLLAATRPGDDARVYLLSGARDYGTDEIYLSIRKALGKGEPRLRIPIAWLRWVAGICEFISAWTPLAVPFGREPLDKLTGSARYSCARARTELGFEPRRDFAGSVHEMLRAEGLVANTSAGAVGSSGANRA